MKLHSAKIQPIHLNSKLQVGKIYHNSPKNKPRSHTPTPYIQLLALKSTRSQKSPHPRQGGQSFSYRRWYDSALNFTNIKQSFFVTSSNRPQTDYIQSHRRRMSHISASGQEAVPTSAGLQLRRNLKCLRDKVKEKIKQILPQPLDKVQLRSQGSTESLVDGIQCNKITAWRKKTSSYRIPKTTHS